MTPVEKVLAEIRAIATDEHDKGMRFEQLMLGELRSTRPELIEAIRTQGEITEETDKGLAAFLDEIARTFA